ncbi:MAG: FtsX-like permease family protein [Acidobacteria bacterium]|nr:FtsX-like permease family protein [Acidobacteriota bacterium]
MILLRLISWPYFRKHRVRSALTTLGIVLGVAVFTGMHTATQAVVGAFTRTVEQIAGKAQLQITAGESGFAEDVLEKVQGQTMVAVAVPVIEAVMSSGAGQGNLLVLGVDMTGDRSLRDYDLEAGGDEFIDDPLVFLAQPDSLMITREFAVRNNLAAGNRITMHTMSGPRQFTIRGVMKSSGMNQAFGGSLAVMDIYAAQLMFGRGRRFDRIDLTLQAGVAVEDGRRALAQLLGPGFEVQQPAARGQQFESVSAVFGMVANITSLMALFIGLFIIYNTFAVAVAQRRAEIGILRALGATERQIRRLFLLESAMAGVIGSCLGALLGLGMARGMAAGLSDTLAELYGMAQKATTVEADAGTLAVAILLGVGTSLIAGWIPARAAARLNPVQSLQKGKFQFLSASESRARTVAGLAAAGTALVLYLGTRSTLPFYAGYLLAVIAALLLSPSLTLWLVRGLRPLLKLMRPVEGVLAADSLIQSPRRTSGTVAALMLSVGLVVSMAGMTKASLMQIHKWLDQAINADFFVTTSESITARGYRFPESLEARLGGVEGVRVVQPVRTVRLNVGGGPVMLVVADMASIARTSILTATEGNAAEAYRRTASAEGVMISDNLAQMHDWHVGTTLELAAPSGLLRVPVVGVVEDFSDQQGSILMDRAVYRKHWNDSTVNLFRVFVQPGVAKADVRERIQAVLGAETRLFVLSNAEVRAYVLKLTDQWFGITYIQLAVAVLVAILGIVNALTVSISDRRRELGILQAVGALRGQIRRTLWMEGATVALLGLCAGGLLGAVQLYYSLEVGRRALGGFRLSYEYPVEAALTLVPVFLVAGLVASMGPAEAAVRAPLTEALEYE